MYNSELWTLSQTLENSIDSLQRKLLRRINNVKWPKTLSNKDLYAETEMNPWTITIQRKILAWFVHLMCLPVETPAREALKSFINPVKKSPGRQKTTWVSQVLKKIKVLTNLPLKDGITKNIEILEVECSDRGDWRSVVRSITLASLTNMQWRRSAIPFLKLWVLRYLQFQLKIQNFQGVVFTFVLSLAQFPFAFHQQYDL